MDNKISKIVNSLREMALGDIKRASNGGAKIGAFILCSCLIDCIAGFIHGSDTSRDDFKNFVRDYLKNYDPEKLYADLRCKLVHSYSEGGSYYFTDGKENRHLQKENNKVIVNLENFIFDIENALNAYITKLQDPSETALRNSAIKRYDNNGIIEIISTFTTPPLSGSCL